ncbi:MAG TPA: hypothetical protein VGG27_04280 [Magnetospirillaceae bacterium]
MAGLVFATSAMAEDHDCPNHPEATYTLSGDPDSDRAQLEKLVDYAKARGAVCIMAFYDGKGPANGKMLAFRRANWTMEQLTKSGVPEGTISRVLRAAEKEDARKVQVILGP